jgi:hypothetical protein
LPPLEKRDFVTAENLSKSKHLEAIGPLKSFDFGKHSLLREV